MRKKINALLEGDRSYYSVDLDTVLNYREDMLCTLLHKDNRYVTSAYTDGLYETEDDFLKDQGEYLSILVGKSVRYEVGVALYVK